MKITHIPAIASSHFKIIDNFLYSEFFMTPQNIYIICFNHLEYLYSVTSSNHFASFIKTFFFFCKIPTKLYDLSVETSVLSAGILLTVDQDYSTFFILCNSI